MAVPFFSAKQIKDASNVSPKNGTATVLLNAGLGIFGGDLFYTDHIMLGIVQILLSILLFPIGILFSILRLFNYVFDSYPDGQGRVVLSDSSLFQHGFRKVNGVVIPISKVTPAEKKEDNNPSNDNNSGNSESQKDENAMKDLLDKMGNKNPPNPMPPGSDPQPSDPKNPNPDPNPPTA